MSPAARRLYRMVLFAYPAPFRREYGREMEQLVIDRHRDDREAEGWVVLREIVDAARSAPRMRWETPMNRVVIISGAATVAVAWLVAGGPLAFIPVAATAVAAWFLWGRQPQPIAPARTSRHKRAWLVAGGLSIATGVAIPQIDGGELSALWWAVMAVALLGGVAMVVAGVLLAMSERGHRLAAAQKP